MNKMTDEEIKNFKKEVNEYLKLQGIPEIFPDWNAAYLAVMIDTEIIYDLIKKNDR
jgi:hypothetical protein